MKNIITILLLPLLILGNAPFVSHPVHTTSLADSKVWNRYETTCENSYDLELKAEKAFYSNDWSNVVEYGNKATSKSFVCKNLYSDIYYVVNTNVPFMKLFAYASLKNKKSFESNYLNLINNVSDCLNSAYVSADVRASCEKKAEYIYKLEVGTK